MKLSFFNSLMARNICKKNVSNSWSEKLEMGIR